MFILLASVIPQADADQPQPVAGVIKIVLGAVMLLLAVKQWRSRPKPGEEAALPTWMSAIDQLTPAKGLGLGFLLSAVNPKNLLMAAGAGVVIGSAQLATGELVVAVVVFTVIAAASVAVPVIGYLLASQSLAASARVPAGLAGAEQRDGDGRPAARDRRDLGRQGPRQLLISTTTQDEGARRRMARARSRTGRSTISSSTRTTESPAPAIRRAQAISSAVGAKPARTAASCAGWMHSRPPKPSARAARLVVSISVVSFRLVDGDSQGASSPAALEAMTTSARAT